jgi:hypothetical protein
MAAPREKAGSKKSQSKQKPAKKRSSKRQAPRDVPAVPTPKEIERSIDRGKTLLLSEFVKRVKL